MGLTPENNERNSTAKRNISFVFSGDAGEFFGIWFMNKFLTMITLGIYSPWAKVRTLQYFYGNTQLEESPFTFNANPWSILRSRLIAFGLFVIFIISENISSDEAKIVYFGIIAAYIAFSPILTVFVMSFKLRYSSWRGLSFNFNKDYKGAYRVYTAPLLVILLIFGSLYLPLNSTEVENYLGLEPYIFDEPVTLETKPSEDNYFEHQEINYRNPEDYANSDDIEDGGEDKEAPYINPYLFIPFLILLCLFLLALPYFDFINMRFLARNARFGTAQCHYRASAKDYYIIYWRWLLATMLLASIWTFWAFNKTELQALFPLLVILSILYFPLSKAYLKSKRYNLLLGKTSISDGEFQLRAFVPFLQFFLLLITNSLVVMLSLGMMAAWAQVRTVRFMLQHTNLEAKGSLDNFIADQNKEMSAIGEEMADVFDIDVGL